MMGWQWDDERAEYVRGQWRLWCTWSYGEATGEPWRLAYGRAVVRDFTTLDDALAYADRYGETH